MARRLRNCLETFAASHLERGLNRTSADFFGTPYLRLNCRLLFATYGVVKLIKLIGPLVARFIFNAFNDCHYVSCIAVGLLMGGLVSISMALPPTPRVCARALEVQDCASAASREVNILTLEYGEQQSD